jgi:glc operon protein GlcG
MSRTRTLSMAVALLLAAASAAAQTVDRRVITLDGAKAILAAAEAEALKNKWTVAIAVVDESGNLIAFHKIDDTQMGSIDIAIGKARTAARMKRPTKALEDAVAGGRTVMLALEGVTPLEGGVPVTIDGRVIGAVGVSGVTSQQDAQVAQALGGGAQAVVRSWRSRGDGRTVRRVTGARAQPARWIPAEQRGAHGLLAR